MGSERGAHQPGDRPARLSSNGSLTHPIMRSPTKEIGLFLGTEPSAGGVFHYTRSLLTALRALPSHEYRVQVACVGRAWQETLADYPFPVTWLRGGQAGQLLAMACMAARLPGRIARSLCSAINPIAWQLRRHDHALWIFPAQDAIAYQLGVPAVTTVHDLMHRYEPHFPEVVRGMRYHIREHRFRNLVDWGRGVLVDSEVGRTHVVESYGVDAAKVYPLPFVSPLERASAGEEFESRYTLPPKFFFYPAQFWAHKNHIALISAAAAIRPSCPDIHLVFTGGVSREYEKIRAHAAALGMLDRVTFSGYVPGKDLAGFYGRARALVMPTYFGPTNIPPLEALACGCPVAVSNIYAMPEQLGDAALYFDPSSTGELASVLERLWLDDALCARLRDNGQRRVAAWTPAHFARRLQTILDDILSRAGDSAAVRGTA
jgi:glycosyltransferase involved in cell wall biosynthesis